jgi:hypothetical protein
VTRAELCVTEGDVSGAADTHLSVDVPKMRAYVNRGTAQAAQLAFTYLGPTARQSALASGATRVQFGLKLRAADPCNLIYLMWRVEPESTLVVSIKSNPGAHTSSQCGNGGYQNVKPSVAAPVPRLTAGQAHTLRAELHGDELLAYVDARSVWRGRLGPVAATLSGPPGIRSDNARLEFELAVPGRLAGTVPAGCRSGPEESE